jgi:hypothetical protein
VGHEHHKLLAPQAPGDVHLAEVLAAQLRHAAQHLVACGMAVVVVDVLEMVQIQHHQRHGAPSRRARAISREKSFSYSRRLFSPVSGSMLA